MTNPEPVGTGDLGDSVATATESPTAVATATDRMLDMTKLVAPATGSGYVNLTDGPTPAMGYVNLTDSTNKPLDDVLKGIFEKHGAGRLGGASGQGWSSYGAMQKCLYYFKRSYIDRIRGAPSSALEIGSSLHTFLALYYQRMITPEYPLTPELCRDELLRSECAQQPVMEGWRLFESYLSRYDVDYWRPLAVEELAVDDKTNNSCRYDLIVYIEEAQPGIEAGTYVVDHKTTSRFDSASLEGWHNDGEIIGEAMIYKLAKFSRKYGQLKGVIINIISKAKTPQFARVVVPLRSHQLKQHAADLKVWQAIKQLCVATDTWPRSRGNCIGRYGMCSYWEHCMTGDK